MPSHCKDPWWFPNSRCLVVIVAEHSQSQWWWYCYSRRYFGQIESWDGSSRWRYCLREGWCLHCRRASRTSSFLLLIWFSSRVTNKKQPAVTDFYFKTFSRCSQFKVQNNFLDRRKLNVCNLFTNSQGRLLNVLWTLRLCYMSRSFFRYSFKVIVTTFFISQAFYVVGKNKWQNVKRPPNHEYTFITQNNRAILALPPSPPPLSPQKKQKFSLVPTYVTLTFWKNTPCRSSHIYLKHTM